VASELGYITVAEMLELTQKTLATMTGLPKYRGHLMNWYDTHTLEPKPPFFISSVDSGNLVASLWTLQHGCLDRIRRPLLSRELAEGLLDHLRALVKLRALSKRVLSRGEAQLRGEDWLAPLLSFPIESLDEKKSRVEFDSSSDVTWFSEQTRLRLESIRGMVQACMPWLLPEFSDLRK
jgi:hypothetical protein